MKSGVILLLCLSTHLVICSETTTEGVPAKSSSSAANPQVTSQQNNLSNKIPVLAESESPVTYVKQEPVVEQDDHLHDFTKELLNVSEGSSSSSEASNEDEAHQNVRIQELLKGILADEFGGSEEEEEDLEDFDSDEPDVFHEDAGNASDDDKDDEEEGFTTTEAPDGSVTTVANIQDDEEADEAKTTLEPGVTPSDRTSRAEFSSMSGRSGHSGRRGNNKRRNNAGKKKNGKKENSDKYNRYVDAVLKRMNTLIKSKRMDPLRVNLYAGSNNSTNSKRTGGNGNNKRPFAGGKKNKPGNGGKFGKKNKNQNNFNNNGQRRAHPGRRNPGHRARYDVEHPYVFETIYRQERQEDISGEEGSMDSKTRPISAESAANKTSTTTISPNSNSTDSESKEMKPGNPNRPTRGVLRGLSTLKRQGQVKVIRKSSSVRVLRSNFALGPVALDILQKSGNASKAETTATATAQKLRGVMEIRLKNSGPTRIRRLRVFPPANVRVKGEKTNIKKGGYRKITPVAAKRLMSVANQVVRQSDQNRSRPGKNNKKNKQQHRTRPGQQKRPGQSHKRTNNNNGQRRNNKNAGVRRKAPAPRDDRHEQ